MWLLLAEIEFEYPARLGWLAVLPLLAYFAWRTRSTASSRRRLASFACRALAVALLVAAFAGIAVRGTSDQRRVILLVDRSRSVEGEGRLSTDRFVEAVKNTSSRHDIVVWDFADRPVPAGRDPAGAEPPLNSLASDLATAVQLASAAIPDRFVPQIVLLSDGIETQGQVAKAALGAGVPIDVVPLPAFGQPDACLLELVTRPLDPVTGSPHLEIVAYSNHSGAAQLQVTVEGQTVAEESVALVAGENRFPLSVPANRAVSPLIQVTLLAQSDSIPENNVRRIRLPAIEKPRILLIDAHPTNQSPRQTFREALAGERFTVDVSSPDQLAAKLADPAGHHLIVLAGVSPRELDEPVYDELEQYVRQGGGLIVMGGNETFGESVYRGSGLERLLPVTAAAAIETRKPVVAIALVIDRSGSMEAENRMELAKLAAKQSVQVLDSQDKAGVMAFSDAPLWVAEIEPVGDKVSLLRQIDTLQPAGQTNMYQAVERAFLALLQTVADRRYMILLTDGIPSPGDYREIAQRMADRGITLSTVSLGYEAEQDLLVEMARIAGGRHHHCDDPKDVPGVMVRETRAATADDTPQSFATSIYRSLPGLQIAGSPQLAGYVLTNPKPEAEQLLMAAGRDPLLVWWPHGSGIAVALTCDAGNSVNQAWQQWPGYTDFWQRLVRHAARRPAPPRLELSLVRQGATAFVRLDFDPMLEDATDPETVRITVSSPDGNALALTPIPVVAGRYEASFPSVVQGEYRVEASIDRSAAPPLTAGASLFVDYPDELRLRTNDVDLLQAIATATGGRYDPEPTPESLLAPDGRTVQRRHSPWRYLVLAALLLIVTDLAIRRIRF